MQISGKFAHFVYLFFFFMIGCIFIVSISDDCSSKIVAVMIFIDGDVFPVFWSTRTKLSCAFPMNKSGEEIGRMQIGRKNMSAKMQKEIIIRKTKCKKNKLMFFFKSSKPTVKRRY